MLAFLAFYGLYAGRCGTELSEFTGQGEVGLGTADASRKHAGEPLHIV
jgi:hypothetical protein